MDLDINEKTAIIYLFNVLSANMLDKGDYKEYVEENKMLLNPVERYMKEKGIKEGIKIAKLDTAGKLLDKGLSIDEIVEITGLTSGDILNIK